MQFLGARRVGGKIVKRTSTRTERTSAGTEVNIKENRMADQLEEIAEPKCRRAGRQLLECPDCGRRVSATTLTYSHKCAGPVHEANRAQELALTAVEKFRRRAQAGQGAAEKPVHGIAPQREYAYLLSQHLLVGEKMYVSAFNWSNSWYLF